MQDKRKPETLDFQGFYSVSGMFWEGGAGAGEGNRTLVVSLEGFCSTIELHPHFRIDRMGRYCHRFAGSSIRKGRDSRCSRVLDGKPAGNRLLLGLGHVQTQF